MGWNGKNLINANLYKGVYEINGQIQAQDSNIYKYSELTEMLPSGNYVISCKDDNITIVRVYLSNDNIITRYGDKLPKQIQLTNNSKVGFSFRESEASDKIWSIGDNTIDAKIQLEEGSVSTPYEPYYITPSTTVVQENNHTLKAIMFQINIELSKHLYMTKNMKMNMTIMKNTMMKKIKIMI